MNKESGFRVRVEEPLRVAFLEACRLDDSTASQEIRKFMRNYIQNHGDATQMNLFEERAIYNTTTSKDRK